MLSKKGDRDDEQTHIFAAKLAGITTIPLV